MLNAKIVVGGRVTGIRWIAPDGYGYGYRSIPTNVNGYKYRLSFVSWVWICELYRAQLCKAKSFKRKLFYVDSVRTNPLVS